jgi:hypothetical protein
METTFDNWPNFNIELADLDFTNSLDLEELEFEEFEFDLQELELDLQEFELDYEPPQLADIFTP